ncbi:hydroxypyruvate isomerase family protein [Magnetospira sp. QH-2]|uniref:hydroxypyruvate isomerase family protein n=1 Tax=Magnetospira sp. (strain QH-2) TaxID=1288970 RepID=UPI0003E8138D|nr:TIM barrel protein [Magnetospira sp. QH-2]CCQ74470.1 Hydroxypyruvate isomerase [Magnetospira sp. QH-2]
MPRFSANLGFLWKDIALPDAIRAAKRAGFEAVECHWPYDFSTDSVNQALNDTGLPMVGINTRLGINGIDDLGVCAMPGREAEAKGYIDEAIAYAVAIGCRNINAVAGKTGSTDEAEAVYRRNLAYACAEAAKHDKTIVIEPLSHRAAPGYHLSNVEKGLETIKAVGVANLKLMFDVFHVQVMQGDLIERLRATLPHIGHIQIAAVPDRGEPDQGEVNYPDLLAALDDMGWDGYVGAEYHPRGTMEQGLGWLKAYQ